MFAKSGIVLAAMGLAVTMTPARSNDLKVLSAGSVQEVLEQIGSEFTRDNRQTVTFAFTTAGQVRDRIAAGEAFDVAVASVAVIEGLEKSGKLAAGSRVVLGRVGLGIAVREGAPTLDVSTPDAFKRALTDARAVAFTDPKAGGTAGIYFSGLLQKLGIADAVNQKAVFSSGGRDTAERVARGEADIGVTFVSEIKPVIGAKIGGLLPPEMRNYTTYVAAIPSASSDPKAAHAFIGAAAAAAMRKHWEDAGFEVADNR